MEIREMSMTDIENRSAELTEMLKAEDADVEMISKETEELEMRKAEILKEAEERANELKNIEIKEEMVVEEEKKGMTTMEIRSTKEYAKAYASYILSGYKNDVELRKILTENADTDNVGQNDTTYPVPVLLEKKIETAWENDEIMNRVSASFLKGNLKVGFEISGTDAVVHAEGATAPAEEKLVLGAVSIIPETVKKWIYVTTEQYEMGGEEFIDYIYDELAYRIVKKLAAIVIQRISSAPTTSGATGAGVRALTQALGAGTIVNAEALLSGEATDLVAIMNRATWGQLKALQVTSGNNVGDVFDGLTVLFTDALPSYADATANGVYMVVGDLKAVRANFPNGRDIKFVFDDKSKAEEDLVKIVGRVYAGIEVTKPYALTRVVKTA